jgi:hypothetical protein
LGIICLLILGISACDRKSDNPARAPATILDSLQAGSNTIQFYIDYGPDSAVLGFFVKDQAGCPRYFPMYCSTYRGVPPVELNVFLSDAKEEMWVQSSWEGYKTLAYYRVGSDRCVTRYGENAAVDTPTPPGFGGGGTIRLPDMDPAHAKNVLIIKHPVPSFPTQPATNPASQPATQPVIALWNDELGGHLNC